MNVYRRYFKITSGPVMDLAIEMAKSIDESRQQYKEILNDIGADSSQWYARDHQIIGIMFAKEPDTSLYKRVCDRKAWWPKKNSKAGKEINARLHAVKAKTENCLLHAVGLRGDDFPSLFEAGRAYYNQAVYLPWDNGPIVLMSIPWYDENPEVMAKYLTDREQGKCGNCNRDAIDWQPTAEMEAIKHWEWEKLIDDWNESIKTKNEQEAPA